MVFKFPSGNAKLSTVQKLWSKGGGNRNARSTELINVGSSKKYYSNRMIKNWTEKKPKEVECCFVISLHSLQTSSNIHRQMGGWGKQSFFFRFRFRFVLIACQTSRFPHSLDPRMASKRKNREVVKLLTEIRNNFNSKGNLFFLLWANHICGVRSSPYTHPFSG